MANSEYQSWMNKKQDEVTVHISLLESEDGKKIILNNVSLNEAQEFAEPIRIMYPERCVTLYTRNGSVIGNTSWNDQMEMFWEYPVFTAVGETLKQERVAEAKSKNLIASWE